MNEWVSWERGDSRPVSFAGLDKKTGSLFKFALRVLEVFLCTHAQNGEKKVTTGDRVSSCTCVWPNIASCLLQLLIIISEFVAAAI